MSTLTHAPADCAVVDLLTGYILASPRACWPGADGMLVEDVLSCYRGLATAGDVPSEAELSQLHPELAARLTAYFVLTFEMEGPPAAVESRT